MAEDFKRRDCGGGGVARYEQVVESKSIDTGGKVFELGVDFEADEVTDDEKGRIVERFVILVELLVCLLEVATLGFVFPGEETALPYVSVAFISAAGLGDALLVGVVGADLVSLGGVRDVECLAKVTEVI